jgi:RNA polymerase sigma factor (sigma-70 family)
MATNSITKAIAHLRETVLGEGGTGSSDSGLLDDYIARRDDASFAPLIHRHGPMVLDVCRRILGNEADAEDAFQATFLVFVRKAASIRSRSTVSNWLYGVAHNTALKAKAMNRKRRAKECEAGKMPRPQTAEHAARELQVLLDAELSRLPDKYRAAIVLCELEGKTIKEAAQCLGLPQGTIASRLGRGRALLGKRLQKQGLTLPCGLLALPLAWGTATAGVPPGLVLTTLNAARVFAAGETTAAAVSPAVTALSEGVLKAMLMKKLKIGAALMAAVVLLGVAGTAYRMFAAESRTETTSAVQAVPPTTNKSPSKDDRGDNKLKLPRSRALEQVLVSLDNDGSIVVKVPIGRAYSYNLDDLRVLDTKGRKIEKRQVAKLIQGETVAMAADHGLAVDPLHLRVLKEDTLVFILPPPDPRAQFAAGGTVQGAAPNLPPVGKLDLPTSRPLEQVLVSLGKDNKLVVKTVVTGFMLADTNSPGRESRGVELRTVEGNVTVDLDDVRALDTKGNTIDKKALARLIRTETVALAALDGGEVDPLHLRVLKEGTLVLILPDPKAKGRCQAADPGNQPAQGRGIPMIRTSGTVATSRTIPAARAGDFTNLYCEMLAGDLAAIISASQDDSSTVRWRASRGRGLRTSSAYRYPPAGAPQPR